MPEPFKRGDRVKHEARPDWGLGEVLEDQIGNKVDLIFENGLFARNMGLPYTTFDVGKVPFIVKATADSSESEDLTWLVNRYRRRPKNKKAVSSPIEDVHSFDEAVKKFLRFFGAGFQDPKYLEHERVYKLSARDRMLAALGPDQMRELLSSRQFDEIWKRACKVMATSGQFVHHIELSELNRAIDSPGRKQLFAEALGTLLWKEDSLENRFKTFTQMLHEIRAASWPVATYFLFLAFHETQIFLKPLVTQPFAEICRKEIYYDPKVNWITYNNVLDLARHTKKELINLGQEKLVPKDMIDVQSFMWIVVKYGP